MRIERRTLPMRPRGYIAIAELMTDDGKVIRRPNPSPYEARSYLVASQRLTAAAAEAQRERDIPLVIRQAERDGVI